MRTSALLSVTLLVAAGVDLHAASAKELYQRLSPGVVCILAMRDGVDGCSLGTGSIIDARGRVLTNCHVITVDGKLADKVLVFRKPTELSGDVQRDLKEPLAARVVKVDGAIDLALLELPAGDYTPVLKLDAERAVPGEPAVAIGHPGHGGLWTLTTGTVSSFLADHGGVAGKNVYQTETAVNPGNSGGPLISGAGTIIGVNTFVIRQNEAGVVLQGLQFALTSQVALAFLEGAGLARAGLVPALKTVVPAPSMEPVIEENRPGKVPEPIVSDLQQEARPYRQQDLDQVLKAHHAAVDKALGDLDQAVEAQMGK